MSGGSSECWMEFFDARMRAIDGELALPRIYGDRCHLRGASVNVYDEWRAREYLREGHFYVEQFVETASLVEPEIGGCEGSTGEFERGGGKALDKVGAAQANVLA